MFGMFESLTKAAVGIVTMPIAVVADVVTLGGALTDQKTPYSAQQAEKILDNLDDAIDPKGSKKC